MSGRSWLLTWEGERWPTTNEHFRSIKYTQSADSKYWRGIWAMLAIKAGIPTLDRISLQVQTMIPHKGRRDTDADYVAGVKFGLDGLVDAKVVRDDTWSYVRYFTVFHPLMGSPDWCLRLKVIEEASDDG